MTFFTPLLTTVGREHHQGDHKPGKPGILLDFYEHGELCHFCATSGKYRPNSFSLIKYLRDTRSWASNEQSLCEFRRWS